MAKKPIVLDAYEQDIEDNYESLTPVKDQKKLIDSLVAAAKQHTQAKKPVTIRLSVHDIEAMKIKASKYGLPYQSYINMLIHKDATSL